MDDQVIKLYEYDYDKPELSEETLEHHGILGMKWGVQNGPPYPLDSDVSTGKRLKSGKGPSKHKQKKTQKKRVKSLKKARKAKEQKRQQQMQEKKSKEEIISTKDIAAMLKDVDTFSNQEIQDMLTRLDWEGKLKERVDKQAEARKSAPAKAAEATWKAVKEGAAKGATSTVSLMTSNAAKMGIRKMVEAIGGDDEQAEALIEKLFYEKKK